MIRLFNTIKVTEIQTTEGIRALSVREYVEIQVIGVNDNPVTYVSQHGRITGNQRTTRVSVEKCKRCE